ncbi:MAG: GlmU family protein [Bacteroidota bacterium]
MDILFYDSEVSIEKLLPFTFTRPISEIRIGIFKISEKWRHHFKGEVYFKTSPHLSNKFSDQFKKGLIINGGLCPSTELTEKINALRAGQALFSNETFLAAKAESALSDINVLFEEYERLDYHDNFTIIENSWNIFQFNAEQIEADIEIIRSQRTSAKIEDPHTILYGDNIFIEEGATIRASILNSEKGPIYIGKNSKVYEGSIINGAFALCEEAHLNIGAKVKGDTTIGPYSKAGGEISNSVLFGYSNKGHDGFLGNSVIGEWCNLGADTNTSNLKNNYAPVKLWDYSTQGFKDTGLQFCGLMMGDHAKCGINTMFNTGTVVGVGANVFGAGFPRNYIPEFAWGGAHGYSTFKLSKFFETAEKVMERREIELTTEDRDIFEWIYQNSEKNRFWEQTK